MERRSLEVRQREKGDQADDFLPPAPTVPFDLDAVG